MSSYTDRIQPTSAGIYTYLENLLADKYQIPTFQRDVVWEKENVKKLWDSVYKFYPLGSILVWKTQTKLQSHRKIGGIPLSSDYEVLEYQYILDGQQRTTSLLTSLFGGVIAGQEGFDPMLYVDLTIGSGESTDDERYKTRFVFWNEIDDRGGELLANKGRKQRFDQGLIVPIRDIWKSHGDAERRLVELGYQDYDDPVRQELRRIRDVLDNYRISFIELKGIQVAEVCQIFERINQAGKPLNIFDIVVAKTFRPDTDDLPGFYLREVVEEFKRSISDSSFSEIDDLTLLQIIAVLINIEFPDARILNITDRYLNDIKAEHLERIWPEATLAIKLSFDFLAKVVNIRGPSLVPYRYLYMILTSYFFRNKTPDYSLLKRYFWFTCFHNTDLLSNTAQLREQVEAMVSARDSGNFVFERFVIDRNVLRETSYSSRGRMSRALLALYASRKPQDWDIPHRDVISDVYFLLTDKPNLHHVFPREFVASHAEIDDLYVNSLLNIAYLTQITNLRISSRNPLEYLRTYDTREIGDVMARHLIPMELFEWSRADALPENSLQQFIELRAQVVLQTLRAELDDIQFDVFDSASSDVTSKSS